MIGATDNSRAPKLGFAVCRPLKSAVVALAWILSVGCTPPIHEAARTNNWEAIGINLDRGVDVNLQDRDGVTPLADAVTEGGVEAVDVLVSRGADVKATYGMGFTLLHLARKGRVVESLITAGAVVDAPATDGGTPLLEAAYQGNVEVAAALLEHGARVDARNRSGWTPLHAAAGADVGVVRLLLARGADVSARDRVGLTPLHHAASRGRAEIVAELLAAGADPMPRNLAGQTPFEIARRKKRTEVVKVFECRGVAQ